MQPKSLRLISLKVSPWSERVKWALDHHRLPYQNIEHAPFIGERRLRRIVGPGRPRATVPVLLTGEQVLCESWDIACYADRVGAGSRLIPPSREAEVHRWNELADATMGAGRTLVSAALMRSPAAVDETLPPQVPTWLRPVLRPVGMYGVKWFARKYGLELADLEAPRAKLRSTLEVLRAALRGDSPYLLDSFSYADIVMATCLQGVAPVDGRYIALGPATRQAWTCAELAAEFPDVLAWRDRLYAQHRL